MAFLHTNTSNSPPVCQMSAKRATAGIVFFSPLPPMRTGIFRSGGGTSLVNLFSMRSSASTNTAWRDATVPKS
jgi:hypothetical protein